MSERPFRIFIGWDSRFPEPAEVLAHSIRRRTLIPIEINYLNLAELIAKHKFHRLHDPKATTEFTFSRFLVPHLCGYTGTALFLDNDMLCFGDVAELAQLPMDELALRVVQHDYRPDPGLKMNGAVQEPYPRKNWSSAMLMNCSKLQCWTKDVVETASGARLHRFQDIPDEQIGGLNPVWNTLDDYVPGKTKLVHWTSGMFWNHPDWKELRQRNALPPYPHGQVWLEAYDRWRSCQA